MIKHKKHNKIVKDYDKQKSKHLKKLANKYLDNNKKNSILQQKQIKGNFLKNF